MRWKSGLLNWSAHHKSKYSRSPRPHFAEEPPAADFRGRFFAQIPPLHLNCQFLTSRLSLT